MKTIDENTFPSIEPSLWDEGSRWLVLKFGGTSVAGRKQWNTIANLAQATGMPRGLTLAL